MKTWVLTDIDQDCWVDHLKISGADLGLPPGHHVRVEKTTLRGGARDGVDRVLLDNGLFAIEVLPTRGMGFWRGNFQGMRIGWDSPVSDGPVHPARVHLDSLQGLGWLTGFDEWICRCGLETLGPPCVDRIADEHGVIRERPVTLHGRIANQSARRVVLMVDPERGEIVLEGVVDEACLFGARLRLETRIHSHAGSRTWGWSDRVTNMGGTPVEASLLYHCNFGSPLLEAGSRVILPLRKIAPRDALAAAEADAWDRFEAPVPGKKEAVFFAQPAADADGASAVLLQNASGESAAEISFNIRQLPWFTLWKNGADHRDGYVTGLEPCTTLPNPRPFERSQGRVATLAPGESMTADLACTLWNTKASVSEAAARIAALQGECAPEISTIPLALFSPDGV